MGEPSTLKKSGHGHHLHGRSRSADLGGLRLAMSNNRDFDEQGRGWLSWQTGESVQTVFAEMLSDMYTETNNAVNAPWAEFPAADIPPSTRIRLINLLDSWAFEPHELGDEDAIASCMLFFEALWRIEGMEDDVGAPFDSLPPLLAHLRQIYRWQNSYHNFEHALDVLQATYCYLRDAGLVPSITVLLDESHGESGAEQVTHRMWKPESLLPPTSMAASLNNLDLFVVCIAAIGHDVGHPGFTNLFMKNAQTPLALVYSNKSPLEQMHTSLLLRCLRCHGFGKILDSTEPVSVRAASAGPTNVQREHKPYEHMPKGNYIRKLLWETVLATDMSVHDEFMARLQLEVDSSSSDASKTGGAPTNISVHPMFQDRATDDVAEDGLVIWKRKILTCQSIIKCADISNPTRPFDISLHWSSALLKEWASQANLEKALDLPSTVPSVPSASAARPLASITDGTTRGKDLDEELVEAKSQTFFGTKFVRPLIAGVARGIPAMNEYLDWCQSNLDTWAQKLQQLEVQIKEREAVKLLTSAETEKSQSDVTCPSFENTCPPATNGVSAGVSGTKHPPHANGTQLYRPTRSSQQPDDYLSAFPLTLPRYLAIKYGAETKRKSRPKRMLPYSPHATSSSLADPGTPPPFCEDDSPTSERSFWSLPNGEDVDSGESEYGSACESFSEFERSNTEDPSNCCPVIRPESESLSHPNPILAPTNFPPFGTEPVSPTDSESSVQSSGSLFSPGSSSGSGATSLSDERKKFNNTNTVLAPAPTWQPVPVVLLDQVSTIPATESGRGTNVEDTDADPDLEEDDHSAIRLAATKAATKSKGSLRGSWRSSWCAGEPRPGILTLFELAPPPATSPLHGRTPTAGRDDSPPQFTTPSYTSSYGNDATEPAPEAPSKLMSTIVIAPPSKIMAS